MPSAVETLSPTRVRLTVDVPFADLKPEIDSTYKEVGRQVKVQGFRPGKVPQRLLDQRVGRPYILEQAVQEAVPRLYSEAVQESGVTPVAQPQVEVTRLEDGESLTFTAEVDVRPEITLPTYEDLTVTVDAFEVSDEQVQEQIDALRTRFATLTPVERPAQDGDVVSIDLSATVEGEEVEGGTAAGLSYEVGKGDLLDGLDEVLVGKSAGDATVFQTALVAGEHEGKDADVALTVQVVNERTLPEVDETFATDVAGFESVEAFRADVVERIGRAKRLEQGVQARDKVLEALLEAIEVPLPQSVVDAEVSWRTQSVTQQLAQAGLTMEGYLESEEKTAESYEQEVREGAEQSVKSQLVLDSIADAEELGVSEQELSDHVVRRAQQGGVAPQQLAQQIVENGQLQQLVAEVRRGKALATVMAAAKVVDSDGAEVDLEALRTDLPGEPTFETDEQGRRYHVHDDGAIHYFDEG